MKLITEVEIAPLRTRVSYGAGSVALGSCFASEMAQRMERARLRVCANPFGVLFNPASVAAALRDLSLGREFGSHDLYLHGELWHSFSHHGGFSRPSKEEALTAMNTAAREGARALADAQWVILTLGTAWVYERGGEVAANCHKLPAGEFTRRRMEVEQIVDLLGGAIEEHLRGKTATLTVSPVRHLRDGLAENSRSKAILVEAAHRICERIPAAEYFPAFEIAVDELRDYRFCAPDMAHPTAQAADYIWERFRRAAADPATIELMGRVEQIVRAAEHRPLHPDTPSHAEFRASMAARARELQRTHPGIDLRREIEYFQT